MPNVGPLEVIVVAVIAIVIFGPRKLPELGKSAGAAIRNFKSSVSETRGQLEVGKQEPAADPEPGAGADSSQQPTSPWHG